MIQRLLWFLSQYLSLHVMSEMFHLPNGPLQSSVPQLSQCYTARHFGTASLCKVRHHQKQSADLHSQLFKKPSTQSVLLLLVEFSLPILRGLTHIIISLCHATKILSALCKVSLDIFMLNRLSWEVVYSCFFSAGLPT